MSSDKEFDVLLAQYHECFEHLRMAERWIWTMPTIIISIAGGVAAFAFDALRNSPIEKMSVLIGAAVFLFIMAAVLRKHRFFTELWSGTLARIEDALIKNLAADSIVQHVRLKGRADHENLYCNGGVYFVKNLEDPDDKELWAPRGARKIERRALKQPAPKVVWYAMLILGGCLITLGIVTWFLPYGYSSFLAHCGIR
jgi:hypothetical protein